MADDRDLFGDLGDFDDLSTLDEAPSFGLVEDEDIEFAPPQEEGISRTFKIVGALKPSHVSVYILEGVRRPEADDRDARLFLQAVQALLGLGFEQYEVSNFCLPGKASRHNLKYWRMEPYLGLGPSAAGYLDGADYRNLSDLNRYGAALQSGRLPQVKTKQMDAATRRVITGLRLLAGISASAFEPFPAATKFLLSQGFLCRHGRNIAVPPAKILLLNEILGYFI